MDINKIYELNKKYEENDFNGVYHGISNLKIINGNIPVLFSAPHAVKQVRNGIFKRSDGLTGGIVEYLSLNKNIYGITRIHNMLDDPNFYSYGISAEYKRKIVEIIKSNDIKFFFDIHGCSNKHNFSIDIGTNNGINTYNSDVLDILLHYFSKFDKVLVDKKFKASAGGNISKYVHEIALIPSFQIEISEEVRFNKTSELMDSLEKIIDEVKIKKLK